MMHDTEALLAPYAARSSLSRGRRHDEPPSSNRTEFQRDRDRIVHSAAFRRLEYKTQVFINHEGDLFRTRLTHSIEVAQIARSLARNLRLNEDLIEAIALAHDLGHTPFGHAGQEALNHCMKPYGGFEHNLQSLRVVETLEARYAAFDGLNLSYETREGILKHCSRDNALQLGDLGVRFIEHTQPTLEAQITNLADEIAYNNHDIDDGLRSGLITLAQLQEVPLFVRFQEESRQLYPHITERKLIHETIRRMINFLITDLISATTRRLAHYRPGTVADVRAAPPIACLSETVEREARILKRFLRKNLYQHYRVNRMTSKAKKVITELFGAFLAEPQLLPPTYQMPEEALQPRAIADYIAGMTDRYAIREHQRLFQITEYN